MFQQIYLSLFDRFILDKKSFTVFTRLIKDAVTIKPTNNVLDIGCGTGVFSTLFKPENYTGIDISKQRIRHSRQKYPSYTFLEMSGTHLEFQNKTFDLILVLGVLHHMSDEDTKKMLYEMRRVLKPTGEILLIEPALSPTSTRLNTFMRFIDKGRYIRYHEQYSHLFKKYFKIKKTHQFITELLYNAQVYVLKL